MGAIILINLFSNKDASTAVKPSVIPHRSLIVITGANQNAEQ